MNRGFLVATIIALLFQGVIALGLFVFAYMPPFGLTHLAQNGTNLLRQIDSIQSNSAEQCITNFSASTQLVRSVLVSSNDTFEKLASLLGNVAFVSLVCLVVQIIVLVTWRRSVRSK